MNRLITITHERLERAKTPKGSYNHRQLRLLGVEVPPKKGWADKLIGTQVTLATFIDFVRFSGNEVYLREIIDKLPLLNPPILSYEVQTALPTCDHVYIHLTPTYLHKAKTPAGGYTNAQIRILKAEPTKGWLKALVGTQIEFAVFLDFVRAGGNRAYLEELINNPPALLPKLDRINEGAPPAEGVGDRRYMTITREYLNKAKTTAGGYTNAQVKIVAGTSTKGWLKALVGTQMDFGLFLEFVRAGGNYEYAAELSKNPPVLMPLLERANNNVDD